MPQRRVRVEIVIIAAFAAIVAYMTVSGHHTTTPTASSTTNAQHLADLDGDTNPVADYIANLGQLDGKCTQDETQIAALADAGYQDLETHGITDETRLSVLLHLYLSIPAGSPRMDCQSVLAAYLTLREG